MVCEVAEEATSITVLKSSESDVIRYPILGGGDGTVQETNRLVIPFCMAVMLVGAAPVPIHINSHNSAARSGVIGIQHVDISIGFTTPWRIIVRPT